MSEIEELLRRRGELIREIDREILRGHIREATFLFTDIVGSTRYYEQRGDIAGRQMVLAHNDLLFPILAAHGGRILKTIGDSIMAIFGDAASAVICTAAMQHAITEHAGAAEGAWHISVRMGLHYGSAVHEDSDVFGDAVNTAERVESYADGGQIVVSGAVQARAKECGVPMVFLGTEAVKGREQAVDLYLVDWQSLGAEKVQAAWRERKTAGRPSAIPATMNAAAPQSSVAASSGGATPEPPGFISRRVVLGAGPDLAAEAARLPALPRRGNPYLNRVMIPHPDLFVGRRALVRKILGRLLGSRPQSLSVVGERRIGKSSLLNFLRSPRARAEFLEAPERCLFTLVDFQQTRAVPADRLVALLLGELRRQTGMTIEGPEDYDSLRQVGEAVAEAACRLVFLFDEFEAVTKNPAVGPEFYAFLRSLANTLPVCFICASGRDLKDLCATREISDSPFFNIFSSLHLGPFEARDAEALVGGPSEARGIPLSPILDTILSMGGRLPFFLQIACSAWFEHLDAGGLSAASFVGAAVPAEVMGTFREEAMPHFEFIVESLPAAELRALCAAATDASMDPDVPAVQSLCRRGYIATAPDQILPFSAEFARFLRSSCSKD